MVNNLDFTGIQSLLQVHSFAVLESMQPQTICKQMVMAVFQ